MQVANHLSAVAPIKLPASSAHDVASVHKDARGLGWIVPGGELFPEYGTYFNQLAQHHVAVDAQNSQAVSDAKRAVNDVIDYYRSIGVTPQEGARDIKVEFDPDFKNAAYVPRYDTMIVGVDPRTNQSFADTSPDVVAHELGHRIATDTGVLVVGQSNTQGENGAVQEHIADVFASAYDKKNWTIGETPGYQPIRDLANPGSLGHPETYMQFERMYKAGDENVVYQDKDGQHIDWHNVAEIPNHAAYELGKVVGRDNLAKIYLNAMRNHMIGANADLGDLALGVAKSTGQLFGADSTAYTAAVDAFEGAGLIKRT